MKLNKILFIVLIVFTGFVQPQAVNIILDAATQYENPITSYNCSRIIEEGDGGTFVNTLCQNQIWTQSTNATFAKSHLGTFMRLEPSVGLEFEDPTRGSQIRYKFDVARAAFYEIFVFAAANGRDERRCFYWLEKDGEQWKPTGVVNSNIQPSFVWKALYDRSVFGNTYFPVGTYTIVLAMADDGFALDKLNIQEVFCFPNCESKNCGDDGCGGSCGDCTGTDFCSIIGTCICETCEVSQMQPPGSCSLNFGFELAGVNSLVTKNFPWPEDSWTVEFWTKGGDGTVMTYSEPEGYANSFGFEIKGNGQVFQITLQDGQILKSAPSQEKFLSINYWTHFAISYSSVTTEPNINVYIQKQYPGAASREVVSFRFAPGTKWKTGGDLTFGHAFRTGRYESDPDAYIYTTIAAVGIYDDFKIWNFPRTIDQIEADRETRLDGGQVGLVAYWNFENLGPSCELNPDPSDDVGLDIFGLSSVTADQKVHTYYECPRCYRDKNEETEALFNLMVATSADVWYNTKNWEEVASWERTFRVNAARACQAESADRPFGVTCHNFGFKEGTRITEITLAFNNLVGTLPESFQEFYNDSITDYDFMKKRSEESTSGYPRGALMLYYPDSEYYGPSSESSTVGSLSAMINNHVENSPSVSQLGKIDANWGYGCPLFPCSAESDYDEWSSVWYSTLVVPLTGDWKFWLEADDRSQLFINGEYIGYSGQEHTLADLTIGDTLNIKIEHYDRTALARVILSWKNYPFTCSELEWDNRNVGYTVIPSENLQLWDDADTTVNTNINRQKWYARYDFENALVPDMGAFNTADATDITLEFLGAGAEGSVVVDTERGNVVGTSLLLTTVQTTNYFNWLPSGFSITGYFKMAPSDRVTRIVSIQPDSTWVQRTVYIGVNDGKLQIYGYSTRGFSLKVNSGARVDDNEWHFFSVSLNTKTKTLVGVVDDARERILDAQDFSFVDGLSYQLTIGAHERTMFVDDITFYKTPLTSPEVLELRENNNRFLVEEEENVSWRNAYDYCKLKGKNLCFAGQWCKDRENRTDESYSQYEPLFTSASSPWTPVGNSENEWIFIGDNVTNQCETYTKIEIMGKGSSPITSETSPAIRCCVDTSASIIHPSEVAGKRAASTTFFEKLGKLRYIYLHANGLRGDLPESIKHATSLSHIYIQDNEFSSELPEAMKGLSSLEKVSIANNQFSGNFPELGNLKYLQQIEAKENHFSGSLPTKLGVSISLENVDFSDNNFSGEIPSGILNSRTLKYIDLSGNIFSGSIPDRNEMDFYCTSLEHGIFNTETEECDCISPYGGDYCQLIWFEFPTVIQSAQERLEWVAAEGISDDCVECNTDYPKSIHYGYYDSTKATVTSWMKYKRPSIIVYDVKPGTPTSSNPCLPGNGLYRGNIDGSSASVIRSNLAEDIRCIERDEELYGYRTYDSMWILSDWLPVHFQDFQNSADANNWQTTSSKKRAVTSIKDYSSIVGKILGGDGELDQNSAIETTFDVSSMAHSRVKVNFRMLPVQTQPGEEIKVFANDKLVKTIKYDISSHNFHTQSEDFKNNEAHIQKNLICHMDFEDEEDPSKTVSDQGINFQLIGNSTSVYSKWNQGYFLDYSYLQPETPIDLNNGNFTMSFQLRFPIEKPINLPRGRIFFTRSKSIAIFTSQFVGNALGLLDYKATRLEDQENRQAKNLDLISEDGIQTITFVGDIPPPDVPRYLSDSIIMENNDLYKSIRDSITISGWFKTDSNDKQWLYYKGEGEDYNIAVYLLLGRLIVIVRAENRVVGNIRYESLLKYSDNDWHFFTLFHDVTSCSAYVDAFPIGSSTNAGGSLQTIVDTDFRIRIGMRPIYRENFEGLIDDWRIFNTKLDSTEFHNAYYYQTRDPIASWSDSKILELTFEDIDVTEGEFTFDIIEESNNIRGVASGLYVTTDLARPDNTVFRLTANSVLPNSKIITKIYLNGKYWDYLVNTPLTLETISSRFHWFGTLYDYKLYNRSLTSEELAQNEWGVEATEHEFEVIDDSDDLKLRFESNSVSEGDFSWGIDNLQVSVASATQPQLLSFRKPVNATSMFTSSYAPNRITDGTIYGYTGAVWLLAENIGGFATVDLGSAKDIRYIRFLNCFRPEGDQFWRTKDWRLGVSNDNEVFTVVDSGSFDPKGYTEIEDEDWVYFYTLSTDFKYRYVRFYVDSWYNLGGGLIELEVYGFEKEIFPTREVAIKETELSCKLPSFLFPEDSELDFVIDVTENTFWCPLTGISVTATTDTCEQIFINGISPQRVDLATEIAPTQIEVNLTTSSGLVDFLSDCELSVWCSISETGAMLNESIISEPLSIDSMNNKVYCAVPDPLLPQKYVYRLTYGDRSTLTSGVAILDVKYSCPNDCSEKGRCIATTGECQCFPPAGGVDCSELSCPADCNSETGNGVCNTTSGICICSCSTRCPDPDYTGRSCNIPDIDCPEDCNSAQGQGVCNRVTGTCVCSAGYWGGIENNGSAWVERINDCSAQKCPPNNPPYCNFGVDARGVSTGGVCNGTDGTCDCFDGWGGSSCSRASLSCPDDCNSNGICDTTTGLCTCLSNSRGNMFYGDSCANQYCTNNCSEPDGTCDTSTGVCSCADNRVGEDCSIFDFDCPRGCTGAGDCDRETGQCSCNAGRTGTDCSQLICPGEPVSCSAATSDGYCNTTSGECVCNSNRIGAYCQIRDLNCPDNCFTDHGFCNRQQGKCICYGQYIGDNCKFQSCPNDCSGQGNCIPENGTCECFANWKGVDCSVPDLTCNDCNEASGGGICIGRTGFCQCRSGFITDILQFISEEQLANVTDKEALLERLIAERGDPELSCSIKVCPGDGLCGFPHNGKCNQDTGTCVCNIHRYGEDCSRANFPCTGGCSEPNGVCDLETGVCSCGKDREGPNCDRISCPNNCSGVGICDYTSGVCNCTDRYIGIDCSRRLCPGDGFCGQTEKRGVCNRNTGICECFSQANGVLYGGGDCSLRLCPNNCSAHGTCNVTNGKCSCEKGWTLEDCSQIDLDCPENCGGSNGRCDRLKGECTCYPPWNLPDCTTQDCQIQCGATGTCNVTTGDCDCQENYIGLDCLTPNFPCDSNCSMVLENTTMGTGECDPTTGKCRCFNGFTGVDCTDRSCVSIIIGEVLVNCSGENTCDPETGICVCGNPESYGEVCQYTKCPSNCTREDGTVGGVCDITSGTCGCFQDFTGTDCTLRTCPGDCGEHGSCDTDTGNCICDRNWEGEACQTESSDIGMSILVALLTASASIAGGAMGFILWRNKMVAALQAARAAELASTMGDQDM